MMDPIDELDETPAAKPLDPDSEASAKIGAQAAPLSEALEEAAFRMEIEARHRAVIHASDAMELRRSLLAAGDRFADLADLIEKDRTYDPVGFMRASAKRYRRASGLAQGIVTRRAETAQQARGAERVEPDGEADAPKPKSRKSDGGVK